jgi:hypothetical protein
LSAVNTSPDKQKDPSILIAQIENRLGPASIKYYLEQLDSHGRLQAGAQYESSYLKDSKLMTEEEFIKAHGGRDRVYDGFKNPYTDDELKILLENYRREPATRRATDILVEFALGERTELALDAPRAYASQERQDQEIKKLNEDPLLLDYLDELATIDEKVNATDRFSELLASGETFGRSLLVMQCDAYGIPLRLIPLASIRLGKIYCDAETWELLGFEYKDYKGDKRIVSVEDCIHYEANDYHMTPNARGFGISTAEPTMYTAMSLRTAYEIAIPEIRRSKWAPFHIMQFPEIETQETLNSIAAQIEPGKSQVWGAGQIQIHKMDLNDTRIKELMETIEMSQKEIFRSFGIALVFAYQDEQNRATAQFSANLMRVTKLTKIRTRLRNTLEPQWYDRNLKALIKKKQAERAQGYIDPNQLQPPTPELLQEPQPEPLSQYQEEGIVTNLERTSNVMQLDVSALPFRPRLKFVDKKVDTFLELTAAALGWKNAGVLNDEEALEIAQLEQFVEKVRARKAAEALNTDTEVTTVQGPAEVPGKPQPTTQAAPNKDPIPNFPLATTQGGSILPTEEMQQLEVATKLKAASNEKLKEELALEIRRALRELYENK